LERASAPFRKLRIHLRIGIVSLFLLVILPLMAIMIGWLQYQNASLGREMMTQALKRATEHELFRVRALLGPIVASVETFADVGGVAGDTIRLAPYRSSLISELLRQPYVYSLYFGLASDGGFLQIVRLPDRIPIFGPFGRAPPAGARYVIREITGEGNHRIDSYTYLFSDLAVAGTERSEAVSYDPRVRPWYGVAITRPGIASSGVYIFSGTGQPGLTLSRRVEGQGGKLLGVFGIDIALAQLSGFLAEAEVGRNGLVFIIDADGKLIGHPDPRRVTTQNGSGISVARAVASEDWRIADAIRLRSQGLGDQFEARLGPEGKYYNTSFTPLLSEFGEGWTLAVLVDEEEYLGRIRRGRTEILLAGTLLMLVAALLVMRSSRLITGPIEALIDETHQIRRFELQGGVKVGSRIIEIGELAGAVANMKTSLRSFGRYVPKEVVRVIVSSGHAISLEGERRPLTVMFSDLVGYSLATEHLPPEEVLERLSRYLDAMCKPIRRHHGTIDKFIGDSIMAIWNAPQPDVDHVANGCRTLLACQQASHKLNQSFIEAGLPPLRTRFGLHTGLAVVGNVGPLSRMQYTALGSMVNLASRIEGLNKHFGTELLVTGEVEASVADCFLFRPLGRVVAAGMTDPIAVFQLLAARADIPGQAIALCRKWEEAFAAYGARDWRQAEAALEAFLSSYPNDGPALTLLRLCHSYVTMPPDDSWDGVLRFSSK
jgi:adenylate cyclase